MKKKYEVRHEKQKKLAEIRVVNLETDSEPPMPPLWGPPKRVPSGSCSFIPGGRAK